MSLNVNSWNILIRLLCFIGIALSIYALHVEVSKRLDSKYSALCDVSEHMSCSHVFESRYGTGFGLLSKDSMFNLPNSLFGIIFYSTFFLLSYLNRGIATKFLIILAVASNIGSVYLAVILAFVLHDFCIVCVSLYLVNAGLLVCIINKAKSIDLKSKKSNLKSS